MLYITVMNLLTGMWLQMCQTRNTKLRVQRAPVSKLLSTKEPSENHEPLWVFVSSTETGIKVSTEIKNTYILSFSYLLLIRLLIFLSEIKAGLKTLLNTAAITDQSKQTHRKGKKKKKNCQSLSPWTLKFCELRALEKYSFTFLNHSNNLHCHLFLFLAG